MITVHHLDNSRSQRILWLLEELELPYDIQFYKRDPKTMMAPKSLRAIHPLGKAPIITDTNGNVTLAESGAIIEYIINTYGNGRLAPACDTPEYVRFIYCSITQKLCYAAITTQADIWDAAEAGSFAYSAFCIFDCKRRANTAHQSAGKTAHGLLGT